MAVTRIKNNQVTDSSAGNTQVGINAGTKLQNYSITATKIANNLTYGSDLTITGNLTVQGTTTNVDTLNTLIQDPLITLADGQVSGTPTLDIGTIGLRGSQNSAVLAWKESALEFVTALSTTTVSNTTFTISSYANLHTGNLIAQGTTSLVGNLIGAVNATANITGGNLLTPGLISATSTITSGANITGANLLTGGLISATSNITGGNVLTGGIVSATGNGTFGNISTSGSFSVASISASGNITGGNLLTGGLLSATGNINGGNLISAALVQGATVSASGNLVGGNANITSAVNSATVSATANITGGNVLTGGLISATSTITSAANVIGGNLTTGGQVSATGNITTAGAFNGATLSLSGNVTSPLNVTGNVTGGNLLTGGLISATSNITGGNVLTGGIVSATANVTGGNLITSGLISTPSVIGTTGLTVTTGAGNITLNPSGNVVLNSKYINGVNQPVQDNDAASKIYVDNLVSTQIAYHPAVNAASTTTMATTTGGTITYTQPNGVANGVGALLTTTGSFNLIDGVNVQTVGQRILIKNEGNAVYNGVYTWANATNIVRSTDADEYGPNSIEQLSLNDYFFVQAGNINEGSAWIVSAPNGVITFGTSNIAFSQFSQSQVYDAGNGISIANTLISVRVDNNTTAFDGTGNVIVKAGANLTTPNIGAATGTSLSVTGTLTAASTVGGVITGTSASLSGNVTGGNVVTGGLISATGNITTAAALNGATLSLSGNVTSPLNVTGNITGGNLLTPGIVSATANVTGGNLTTGGQVSATANITGGNVLTGGLISATATITGGNLATGGTASATGNITGGNILTAGIMSSTGNATHGNILTSGIVSATGNINSNANIVATANVIGGNVTTAGQVSATANITGGNILTGGLISATGNITGGNVIGGNIVLTGNSINELNPGGTITVNGAGANTNFAVSGTSANVLFVNATTNSVSFGSSTQTTNAIAAFNTTTSILIPAGTQAQRPGTGVTGMMRFNSTSNALEIYNNSSWQSVGSTVFTVITDQQFNGDGSNTAFTLSAASTTASTIVSINGVLQIPTSAYSVSSTTLTFTEAPAAGDLIDVRALTTTTTVTNITNAPANAAVSVSDTSNVVAITGSMSVAGDIIVSGNATITGNIATNQINNGSSAVQILATNGNVTIDVGSTNDLAIFTTTSMNLAGNILPQANVTYNLGSTTARWNDLWLANSTIYMGNAQISANATSLVFTNPQGGQTVFAGATSSLTGATVSVTGNITGGNVTTAGIITVNSGGAATAIVNGGSTGVGNIGSSTVPFNTIFAKATTAQYADLAEKYTADAEYAPGTVLVFGGTAEVTVNAVDADRRVAGVVSTNPSYTMNSGLESEHVATVALTGRVPTLVVGTVRKGDMMVAAGLGRARAEADPQVGSVIGKALEDFDGAEGTIEVVIGRF